MGQHVSAKLIRSKTSVYRAFLIGRSNQKERRDQHDNQHYLDMKWERNSRKQIQLVKFFDGFCRIILDSETAPQSSVRVQLINSYEHILLSQFFVISKNIADIVKSVQYKSPQRRVSLGSLDVDVIPAPFKKQKHWQAHQLTGLSHTYQRF